VDCKSQTAVQVYDGTNGWRLRPSSTAMKSALQSDQLKEAARQADLTGPLVDYAAKSTKIEMEGVEKVGGKDNYRLKLTFKTVSPEAVDQLPNLPRNQDRRHAPPLGWKMHNVEIYYRDFRGERSHDAHLMEK